MGSRELYTAEQFITAIKGSAGIISTIAKRVGCEWNTAKKYIEAHPSIKNAWENERETVLDMAETQLIKAVQCGKDWAVKYTLSTIGKKRGYVERQEVVGPDGDAIKIEVEYVNSPNTTA